jgi:DMSO reductase anchor subunit
VKDAEGEAFLPGAPSPNITVPTTTYKTRRVLPRNVLPVDFQRVRSSHQHLPLVMLLVLTQLSVGAFVADLVLDRLAGPDSAVIGRPYRSVVALAMGLLALGASIFHLGRPLYAFRAVLGIRTSWMSREVLAFGLFAKCAMLYALSFWIAPLLRHFGVKPPPPDVIWSAQGVLGWVVVGSGVLGVFCSMMLYQVTSRRWWSAARTSARFALTAAVLGLSTTSVTLLVAGFLDDSIGNARLAAMSLLTPLALVSVVKLASDAVILLHLRDRGLGELKRTARLLIGELRRPAAARAVLGAFGAGLAYVLSTAHGVPATDLLVWLLVIWGALFAGEVLERMLFFRALSAPKMPGAVGP